MQSTTSFDRCLPKEFQQNLPRNLFPDTSFSLALGTPNRRPSADRIPDQWLAVQGTLAAFTPTRVEKPSGRWIGEGGADGFHGSPADKPGHFRRPQRREASGSVRGSSLAPKDLVGHQLPIRENVLPQKRCLNRELSVAAQEGLDSAKHQSIRDGAWRQVRPPIRFGTALMKQNRPKSVVANQGSGFWQSASGRA